MNIDKQIEFLEECKKDIEDKLDQESEFNSFNEQQASFYEQKIDALQNCICTLSSSQIENSKYLRLLADFDNYRKRIEQQKSDMLYDSTREFAFELISILDNFDRLFDSMSKGNSSLDGVKIIYRQLVQVLKKRGYEKIECSIGEKFDCSKHDAVSSVKCMQSSEDNTIASILENGYLLNGKIFKPVKVCVYSSGN